MKNNLIINEVKDLREICSSGSKEICLDLNIDYKSIVIDYEKMFVVIPVKDKSLNCSYTLQIQVAFTLDAQASKLCEMIHTLFRVHRNGQDLVKDNDAILERLKKVANYNHTNYNEDIESLVKDHLSKHSVLPFQVLAIEYIDIVEGSVLEQSKDAKSIEEALQEQDKLELLAQYHSKVKQLVSEKVISFS